MQSELTKRRLVEQDLAFVNEQKTPDKPDKKTLADVGASLYHCSASYKLLIKPIHCLGQYFGQKRDFQSGL